MSTVYAYRKDQELPALTVSWLDADGAVIDFSTGWTFTVKIALASAPTAVLVTKTTGITGAATAPNVTIDWSTTDWSTLTATANGTAYVAHLYARRTADSKDRVFRPADPITFRLYAAPA